MKYKTSAETKKVIMYNIYKFRPDRQVPLQSIDTLLL